MLKRVRVYQSRREPTQEKSKQDRKGKKYFLVRVHGSTHSERNGQEKNERKNSDKIKSVCIDISQNIFKLTKNLLVLKKREIAKNAAASRKHKVWVKRLLTEPQMKAPLITESSMRREVINPSDRGFLSH